MSPEGTRPPLALRALTAVYLFSLFTAFSAYGHPFPFLGRCYTGRAAEWFVFADAMISLYLVLGILKRQRLTLWLLMAYNLVDVCNAGVNLSRVSAGQYAGLAGSPLTEAELQANTMVATLLMVLLTLYAFGNRRHFSNRSLYLF